MMRLPHARLAAFLVTVTIAPAVGAAAQTTGGDAERRAAVPARKPSILGRRCGTGAAARLRLRHRVRAVGFAAAQSHEQYCVSAVVPPGHEARLRPMLQEALKATLGFQVRWEDREKDVHILRKADGVDPKWRSREDEEPTSMASGRRMVGRRQPVSMLRSPLNMVLRRMVIDESRLTGPGSWDIEVREDKPERIIEQVRQQLGLRLEATRRKVPVLVVELGRSPRGTLEVSCGPFHLPRSVRFRERRRLPASGSQSRGMGSAPGDRRRRLRARWRDH